MKYTKLYNGAVTIAFLFISLHCSLFAQPPAGNQWFERAFAYAEDYWDNINPEYGAFALDCANFGSQIANAGCSGLCEYNDTNWDNWWYGNCRSYFYSWYTDGCDDCPTYLHDVMPLARDLNSWFYDNAYVYPNYVDVNESTPIPAWTGPGCFGLILWEGWWEDQWHTIFIGAGQGQDIYYWAHTNPQHWEHIYTVVYTRPDHIYFYGPSQSPSHIDEYNQATRVSTGVTK